MREKIDCFLPCDDVCAIADTLQVLRQSKTIQHINLLVTPDFAQHNEAPDNCSLLAVDSITSSESIAVMAGNTDCSSMCTCIPRSEYRNRWKVCLRNDYV